MYVTGLNPSISGSFGPPFRGLGAASTPSKFLLADVRRTRYLPHQQADKQRSSGSDGAPIRLGGITGTWVGLHGGLECLILPASDLELPKKVGQRLVDRLSRSQPFGLRVLYR